MNVCVNNTDTGVSGEQRRTAHHAHLHLGRRCNEIEQLGDGSELQRAGNPAEVGGGRFLCNTRKC